ncbi:MAG: RDD family protein [Mangrovibacterium sp.]
MVYLTRRFAAFYLDGIIIVILGVVFYTLYFLNKGYSIGDIEQPSAPLSLLIQAIAILFYYIFFEFFCERTIGKMVFKFRTYGLYETLGMERFLQVLIRTLIRLFPLDPFSIFLDEEYRTWHDKLSKTKVVDSRKIK